MKITKSYITTGLVIALAPFFVFAARADEWDEATTITFSEPVQIPGEVLPAATYLFKLANSTSDRNIVQIFNSDGTRLYATVPTIPTEREEPAGNTTISLAEQGPGTPEALVKWFYPGRVTGAEFLYSTREEKQLGKDTQHTIAANPKTIHSEAQAGE
jgi:hypothetical protein